MMSNPSDARHILHSLPYLGANLPAAVTMATLLLEAGCHVNTTSLVTKETAMHVAVSKGAVDFVVLYLRHGADFELRDGLDKAPFVNAVWGEKWEVCQVFLRIGAPLQSEHVVTDRRQLAVVNLSGEQTALLHGATSLHVQSLCNLSRSVIRKALSLPFRRSVDRLPIPTKIKEFVCMDCLLALIRRD